MRIGLGVSDFSKLRSEHAIYIDKSLLVRDLLDDGSAAVLLPRPRRFGKTTNLSMLRAFFERGSEDDKALTERHRGLLGVPRRLGNQGLRV